MTFHVANVIYNILCSSRHKDYVTLHFFPCFLILSLFFEHLGLFHLYVTFTFSYPCRLTHSDRNTKTVYSLSKGYLNLLLKPRQDLVPNRQRHLSLYPYPIAQLQGVDTQVSSNDPMGIVHKNTANNLHEIWRRPSLNTNCWNRKSLHSFCNRERLWTPNLHCVQQATRATERLYDLVIFTD